MRSIEITYSSAVAYHKVFESPLITEYLLQKTIRATAWIIVKALICTHHLTYITLCYKVFEGWHICLPEITYRHIGKICAVTRVLRTAMYGIVLGTRPEFTIFRILWSLKTTNDGIAHNRCQIGVLAISLLSSTPSRIAEDVHIRSPD